VFNDKIKKQITPQETQAQPIANIMITQALQWIALCQL